MGKATQTTISDSDLLAGMEESTPIKAPEMPAGVNADRLEDKAASELAKLLAERSVKRPVVPIVDGKFSPRTIEEVMRVANMAWESGLCPSSFKSVAAVAVAMSMGQAIGLDPLSSLRCIAVIQNRPALWGDALVALVQRSGQLATYEAKYTGEGPTRECVVTVKRKGVDGEFVGRFGAEAAKAAGLGGKDTYKSYADRMYLNRARAFALRDGFADMLNGLGVVEEVQDYPAEADGGNGQSKVGGIVAGLPDPLA